MICPTACAPGFHIAELGFGTGLNLLATLIANPGIPVRYTSFEAYPLSAPDIARALDAFPKRVRWPMNFWPIGPPAAPCFNLARSR